MTQFALTFQLIEKLLSLNHFDYQIPSDDFTFLAIRGAIPVDPNSHKDFYNSIELELKSVDCIHYRCTIMQIHRKRISAFKGSTMPGKYWTSNPSNPNGVTRLLEGYHIFRQGFHNQSNESRRYAAFRQVSIFPLLRAKKNLPILNWDKDTLDFYNKGDINLHYGKTQQIGKWSAGCQVITTLNSMDIWSEFKNRVYTGRPDSNKTYSYFLFDGAYVANVAQASDDSLVNYKRILWGSRGDNVGNLQNKLIKLGYTEIGSVDNQYGKRTMLYGVIPYQKKTFGNQYADGIVTQDIWHTMFDGDKM